MAQSLRYGNSELFYDPGQSGYYGAGSSSGQKYKTIEEAIAAGKSNVQIPESSPMTPPPAVITAQPALDAVNKAKTDFADIQTGIQQQQANRGSTYGGPSIVDYLKTVGQPSDYGSRSRLAEQYGIQGYMGTAAQNTQLLNLLRQNSQGSQGSAEAPKTAPSADEVANSLLSRTGMNEEAPAPATTPETTPAEPEATPTDTYLADLKRVSDQKMQAYDDLETKLNQIEQGVFPLSPAQQARLEAVKQVFQNLRNEQQIANQQYTGNIIRIGATQGLQQYNPRVAAGQIKVAVDSGIAQLGKIDAQALDKVSELETAFEKDQYERALSSYKALQDSLEDREQTIAKIYDATTKAAQDAREAEEKEFNLAIKKGASLAYSIYSRLTDDKTRNAEIIYDAAVLNGLDPDILLGAIHDVELSEQKAMKDQYLPGIMGEFQFAQDQGYTGSFEDYKATYGMSGLAGEFGFYQSLNPEDRAAFDEYAVADANRKIPAENLSKEEMSLRKEFNGLEIVKDYKKLKQSYQNMRNTYGSAVEQGLKGKSKAAAEQAIVTLFNKMLDPQSVVREGEYARSFEGQSALQRAQSYWQRLSKGGSLTNQALKDMVDIAQRLYSGVEEMYTAEADNYRSLAQDYGYDPSRIVTDTNVTQAQSLDDFYAGNPSKQPQIDEMLQDGYSEEDIMQILGNAKVSYAPRVLSPSRATGGDYLAAIGSISGVGSPLWSEGLDVANKKGTPIPSPVGGVVTFAGPNKGFGNQVKVKMPNGDEIWFGHLEKIAVRPGQRITPGLLVGLMGNTGNVLKSDGTKPNAKELAAGRGTHVDITMKKQKGGYYSARDVQKFLTSNRNNFA